MRGKRQVGIKPGCKVEDDGLRHEHAAKHTEPTHTLPLSQMPASSRHVVAFLVLHQRL